jgi:hypothetical protein
MNEPVCDKLNLEKLFLLGQYYRQAEFNVDRSEYAQQIVNLLSDSGIYTKDARLATRIAAWIICQNGRLPNAETQRQITIEMQSRSFSRLN